MDKIALERRNNRRYQIHLPLTYRISQKGFPPRTGTGTTRDLSTGGLSFRCRRSLPLGAHVELAIDWPARHADEYPIDLQLTGFIVRSDGGRIGVRITSHRFRVGQIQEQPYRVSA
jgi:hypothetical protein